jgi:aryl-alcohol dehydrogenase-like predicted oxidoreductase
MWGGTDEAESIATIRAAVEHCINVIDTAPACGFGRSEKSSARNLPKEICEQHAHRFRRFLDRHQRVRSNHHL